MNDARFGIKPISPWLRKLPRKRRRKLPRKRPRRPQRRLRRRSSVGSPTHEGVRLAGPLCFSTQWYQGFPERRAISAGGSDRSATTIIADRNERHHLPSSLRWHRIAGGARIDPPRTSPSSHRSSRRLHASHSITNRRWITGPFHPYRAYIDPLTWHAVRPIDRCSDDPLVASMAGDHSAPCIRTCAPSVHVPPWGGFASAMRKSITRYPARGSHGTVRCVRKGRACRASSRRDRPTDDQPTATIPGNPRMRRHRPGTTGPIPRNSCCMHAARTSKATIARPLSGARPIQPRCAWRAARPPRMRPADRCRAQAHSGRARCA
jgi:hypothetical protein